MTFDEAVKARALSVADLVVRKQRDYGPNNIMRNHVRPELALAVRLSDKIARVVNLAEKGTDPSNEALQDTWMDIVGYGLIGLMVLNGEFELPLEVREVGNDELNIAREWWLENVVGKYGFRGSPPTDEETLLAWRCRPC